MSSLGLSPQPSFIFNTANNHGFLHLYPFTSMRDSESSICINRWFDAMSIQYVAFLVFSTRCKTTLIMVFRLHLWYQLRVPSCRASPRQLSPYDHATIIKPLVGSSCLTGWFQNSQGSQLGQTVNTFILQYLAPSGTMRVNQQGRIFQPSSN